MTQRSRASRKIDKAVSASSTTTDPTTNQSATSSKAPTAATSADVSPAAGISVTVGQASKPGTEGQGSGGTLTSVWRPTER